MSFLIRRGITWRPYHHAVLRQQELGPRQSVCFTLARHRLARTNKLLTTLLHRGGEPLPDAAALIQEAVMFTIIHVDIDGREEIVDRTFSSTYATELKRELEGADPAGIYRIERPKTTRSRK